MIPSSISETVKIFFSLAPTSRDRDLFEQLLRHLSGLRRQGLINLWYDSEISAGSNVREWTLSYLNTADIIVLLISADFFASDQCVEVEMEHALKQAAAHMAQVIPVLLRPTDWGGFSLDQYRSLPSNGKPITIWNDLDAALTEVVQGIRQVVEGLARRWINAPRPPKPPQFPLATLPHRRNPLFTDRRDHLDALHHSFTTEQTPQTHIRALHGMAGIGKTLLATEYACRNHGEYDAIFWLSAASSELLSAGMLSLADQIGIPAHHDLNEPQRFAAIKQWLQHHDRWLMVLDDLDDFRALDQFLPLYSHGHVLVITQSQATGQFVATSVFVDQLSIEDGAQLLLRRAKINLQQEGSEADLFAARKIAQELAGYPLALDQAGAYIEENQRTLASYFDHYQKQKEALLSRRGRLASDHPNPVTTTLSLTLQKVAQVDPLALELIRFFAFLHPDGLPDEMITNGASALEGSLRKLALDPLSFDDALTTLRRFSLIHRGADSTTLNIHHILQTVIKKEMTRQQQQQFARQAVRLVNANFPEVLFATWQGCERYLPQAQHCAALIRDLRLTLPEGGELLERVGFYCFQRGCYDEAEAYLQEALSLYKRYRHTNVQDLAQTLNSLGLLYRQQARYKEAERIHERALELRKQALGLDDPKTVESQHNIAMIYGDLGQYQRAEQLYLHALSVEEQAKGPEHPDVADTLNELGLTYAQQGRIAEAEAAYRRALTIYTHARDANHPDLTYPLDGLGALAEQQGDYQQAEAYYQQAFVICQQAFGETHAETAHSIDKLAGIAASRGDDQLAEALYQQALTINEQALGHGHPDVALILNDQALLAARRQQYQAAESSYQRALSIYELALGKEHPAVASVLNNLGQLLSATGNMEGAEQLLRRALAIREKALDAAHPDIAQSRANLANLLNRQRGDTTESPQ